MEIKEILKKIDKEIKTKRSDYEKLDYIILFIIDSLTNNVKYEKDPKTVVLSKMILANLEEYKNDFTKEK